MAEQIIPCVAPFFKGTTINKNMRLEHESLSHPETEILKYHEYILRILNKISYYSQILTFISA